VISVRIALRIGFVFRSEMKLRGIRNSWNCGRKHVYSEDTAPIKGVIILRPIYVRCERLFLPYSSEIINRFILYQSPTVISWYIVVRHCVFRQIFTSQGTTNKIRLFSVYFCKMLYLFQTGFPSIIRSSKLHIQRQVFDRPLLLPTG